MAVLNGLLHSKQSLVVFFASTAIALYGYDQGMMSLINTNYNYLQTMDIRENSPLVGVIVSIYYIGCSVGAVLASAWADRFGRKSGMFVCLATSSLGNAIMFVSGIEGWENGLVNWLLGTTGVGRAPLATMFLGRTIMGLGVGESNKVPHMNSDLSLVEDILYSSCSLQSKELKHRNQQRKSEVQRHSSLALPWLAKANDYIYS